MFAIGMGAAVVTFGVGKLLGVSVTGDAEKDRHRGDRDPRGNFPSEYGAAGTVTAAAYRAFLRPDDDDLDDWERYLARIADIERSSGAHGDPRGGRRRSGDRERDPRARRPHRRRRRPAAAPGEAHIRMLGRRPAGAGSRGRAASSCRVRGTSHGGGEDVDDAQHHPSGWRPAQRMYERLGYVREARSRVPGRVRPARATPSGSRRRPT